MISTSSLLFEGHHHASGLGGPHHVAFVDPYLRGKLANNVPDFMRPFPKPAAIGSRFADQRSSPSRSPRKDYSDVAVTSSAGGGPVNLSSVKMEAGSLSENHIPATGVNIHVPHMSPSYASRMYPPPPGFQYPGLQNHHFSNIYSNSYSSLLNRATYINGAPSSPLESQFSPSQKSNGCPSSPRLFLPTSAGYNNSNSVQSAPAPAQASTSFLASKPKEKKPFKVPSTKDSSGKQKLSSGKSAAKRVSLVSNISNQNGSNYNNNNNNNNNNLLPPNFTKGSLIQLANGDLRRVEDVTTEELVSSAEKCPAFRLDPSTVLRILENSHGTVLLTLSYGDNKTVEMESALEYPYFVYGQGWTSCNPEKTMNCYGLQCSRLKVGDICLSLSPRRSQEGEEKAYGNKDS